MAGIARLAEQHRLLDSDQACLDLLGEQPFDHTAQVEALRSEMHAHSETAASIEQDGTDLLVELNRTGVDPNVRRELSEALVGLRGALQQRQTAFAAEEKRAQAFVSAREAWSILLNGRQQADAALNALSISLPAACWKAAMDDSRKALSAAPRWNRESLAKVAISLQPLLASSSALHRFLSQAHDTESRRYDTISSLSSLQSTLQAQQDAVQQLTVERADFLARLDALVTDIRAAATSKAPFYEDDAADLRGRLEALVHSIQSFDSAVLNRIPFVASDTRQQLLASSSSSTVSSIDLVAVDERVRTYINEACATLSARVESAQALVVVLDYARNGHEHDVKREQLSKELTQVVGRLADMHRELQAASGYVFDIQSLRHALLKVRRERPLDASATQATISAHRTSIAALNSRLTDVVSDFSLLREQVISTPSAQPVLERRFTDRSAANDALAGRIVTAEAALGNLQEALDAALIAQRARQEEAQRLRAAETAAAELRERREACNTSAATAETEIEEILSDLSAAQTAVDVIGERLNAEAVGLLLFLADRQRLSGCFRSILKP